VRVLLDHNLPHKLRTNLGTPGKYEFVTASYMRWGDLKNGELLRAAEENGIEVFVPAIGAWSMSRTHGARLAIVALSTNNWRLSKNHLPRIPAAMIALSPVRFRRSSVHIQPEESSPAS